MIFRFFFLPLIFVAGSGMSARYWLSYVRGCMTAIHVNNYNTNAQQWYVNVDIMNKNSVCIRTAATVWVFLLTLFTYFLFDEYYYVDFIIYLTDIFF
jgi:hypothetical protein